VGAPKLIALGAALLGVSALGFDTSPFIYFIERDVARVGLLREIFRRVDAGILEGFTSAVTLTEVLTRPKLVGNRAIERQYRDLLLHSRHFTLVPIDAAIADSAAEQRARHRLRTPDAIQIAAALDVGCQAFLTNDRALRHVSRPRVLVLGELTL
jgi:predicted nucleic acid-binding protein